MKKTLYIFLLFSSILSAQNTTIVSAAENTYSSSGIVNWAIGNTITGSSKTSKYIVSQGAPLNIYRVVYDEHTKLQINCFPNPVKTTFYLEIQTNTPQEYKWKLYSVTGKLIIEEKPETDLTKINITGLNASIYYLSVFNKKGTVVATAKLIKL